MKESNYALADLLYLMQRLRDPASGCPWDIRQTWQSITPSTLEEAYEVVDAIERGDFDAVREELGDFLFQVVFYTQLAAEERRFDMDTLINGLVEKLIRRHPHVFPDGSLQSRRAEGQPAEDGIKQRWEQIKAEERAERGNRLLFAEIPAAMNALSRAQKMQKRAAQVGFDWPDTAGVMNKVKEELAEAEQAMESGDAAQIEHELGDLLFSLVNLCRHLQVDAEAALRRTNLRFERRLDWVQEDLQQQGTALQAATTDQLEASWERAKRALQSGSGG